jgi:non-specific serine/threonine protein kinase
VGGWTLDALEEVADDQNTLEHLEQLVNKSLVVTEERETEMRYFMLETIRQYAREKLFEANQSSAARDRHFVYFDRLCETMWDAFRSKDMLRWRDRVDDEAENFRAAIEWGLDQHPDEILRLAAYYCILTTWINNQSEGMAIVQQALDKARSLPPVKGEAHIQRQKLIAKALFAKGLVGMGQGSMQLVIDALQEAVAISRSMGDKLILGYSLNMYFTVSSFIPVPGKEEAVREAYAIFTQEIHDPWGLSMSYQNMARLAASRGDMEERDRFFVKLKEHLKEIPLSFQAGLFYLGMGMDEKQHGHFETATQLFDEGIRIFTRLRNKNFINVMISELGHIARYKGDIEQARKIYSQTLVLWQDLGNRGAIAHQLECFAFLAIIDEEPQRAIQLLGAAEILREKANALMTEYEQDEYSKAIARLRTMVTEPEFNTSWTLGRSMTMEEAIEFALAK